jgi:ADP-ribose pyrophosphatase YjhB (NUDIX family)
MDPIVLQVGVKILLKNKEGKFLLNRRNPKKYPEAGGTRWDVVGGRINAGSPLLENLHREVMEETGLKITSEPVLVGAQDILRVPGKHVVRLTYQGNTEGEPAISEESLEFGWFTGDEIKALSEPEIDIYVKELLDKKLLVV